MPKVKVISRDVNEYTANKKGDIEKIFKNPAPVLHPFERPIEYTRALNAVKLDKVFAKPFIGNLSGHKDGVYCLRKHPTILSYMLSGSCDGEIKLWNLRTKTTIHTYKDAHSGFVRGIAVEPSGKRFFSCGDDKTVKLWDIPSDDKDQDFSLISEPVRTYIGEGHFTGIDHQRGSHLFATSGATVEIWDEERAEPISNYAWGADSVTGLNFNPVETYVLSSQANDRSVCLYDIRSSTPIKKFYMTMRTNALCWNPREPFIFATANEDHNCYTFDMRKIDQAVLIHKDHVQAVLDLDFSPTGKEFVTGSYDRTIRIFPANERVSREVYHTKRMQRIFAVQFSSDSSYVLSASEDMNIRLWKANASAPLGVIHPRKKAKLRYQEKLKERYRYLPEIRRIAKHRHLPKAIKVARDQKREHFESVRRKFVNRRKHSARERVKMIIERRRAVEEVEE